MKRDLKLLFLSWSSCFKRCTGKCSEDGVDREGCKLQGLGAPISSSMHTFWVRFRDVVGVMRNDFFKRLKGDQQGLPLEAVQCAVSRCAGGYWLKLPVNGVFLVQNSAPRSSLLVAFGQRVGLGLQIMFLQDVMENTRPQRYQDIMIRISVIQTWKGVHVESRW